jgi:hypothetical protein
VADSKLTPDTTYDYRLAETVDNIGGFFGGWVSNLGDPTDVFTAPQTFTTPATKPPNGTSVSTSTGSGSTTLGCADTLIGCTGTYELLGELNGLVGADGHRRPGQGWLPHRCRQEEDAALPPDRIGSAVPEVTPAWAPDRTGQLARRPWPHGYDTLRNPRGSQSRLIHIAR